VRFKYLSCTITICLAAVNNSDDESDGSEVSELSVGDSNQKEEDAIFIRNLPGTIKFNDLFDLFAKAGRIKVNLNLIENYFHLFL